MCISSSVDVSACTGRVGIALIECTKHSMGNCHFSEGQCHYNCANPGLQSFWPGEEEVGREWTQRLKVKQNEQTSRQSKQNKSFVLPLSIPVKHCVLTRCFNFLQPFELLWKQSRTPDEEIQLGAIPSPKCQHMFGFYHSCSALKR